MPLESGLDGEEIAPVLSTDSLNDGRIKFNDSIEAIRALLNNVESSVGSIEPTDVVGLIVNGSINNDYLENFLADVDASEISFTSPNFGATTVATALEELFNEGGGSASTVSVADVAENFDGTNVEEVLAEISTTVSAIVSSGGTGDVIGPASSTSNNLVTFDGSTGKFIKDSGSSVASFAAASHDHPASSITTGILPAIRGGTGLGNYTTGNFLRASGASSLEQRTPTQLRNDIGAISITGGTFTGNVSFNGAANYNTSLGVANNVAFYFDDALGNPVASISASTSDNFYVGNTSFDLKLRSSSEVELGLGLDTVTLLHTNSTLSSLSDIDVTGASNGEVLTFDGVNWTATAPTGGGGGGAGYLPLTGGTITGNLSLDANLIASSGTAALPSITTSGDTDTGVYFPTLNQVGIATGGTQRVNISNSGLQVGVSGSASAPSISSTSDSDTGLYFSSANTLSVATGGSSRLHFSNDGIKFQSGGTAAVPALSLQSDPNTGVYFSGSDTIGFSTGGSSRVVVSNSGMTVSGSSVLTSASVLSALNNVSGATPATADVLTWNGSVWTPLAPTGGGGGGGGDVTNPMSADLNAASHTINNPRIVGNQDVSYDLSVDSESLISSGVANLTASHNAYHFADLSTALEIKLPAAGAGSLPYGFISIRLAADVSVTVANDPRFVWSKVNLTDEDPIIPNTSGSTFTIFYRFDPVISSYTGTMSVMQALENFQTTVNITAIEDDGWVTVGPDSFNEGGIITRLGWSVEGYHYHTWNHIAALNVPKGAVITSAVISLEEWGSTARPGPFLSKAYMENVDNALRPATFASVMSANLTTGYGEGNFSNMARGIIVEHDFTDALQELVNRPGWVSGNSANLFIMDETAEVADRWWQPYAGSAQARIITVNYQA